MAKTVGERSKEEAQAFKARAWFRGMESMAYGTGEWRGSDGKKLKMRHELREGRTQCHESHAQRHTVSDANVRTLEKLGWLKVDTIALIGVYHDEARMAEIHDMLSVLEHQTPDIFDRYEETDPHRYAQFDIPDLMLGAMSSHDMWAESEVDVAEAKLD